jgi:hypothetical protein
MTQAKNSSIQKRNPALLTGIVFLSLLASCSTPAPKPEATAATESYPLQHVSQDITSSTDHLALAVNQSVKVPVTIKNPSSDTWFSDGKFPVVASFKWFNGGQILPIEGARTALGKAKMTPNDSVSQDVTVVAPGTPGNYELQITLVEEGVVWFNLAGAKPLSIPTTVK